MNKNRKYAINAKVVTVGVTAAVLLLNLFMTLLVQKFPIKLDMTGAQLYELSDETKTMLSQYDTPVDIYFVAGAGYESAYRLIGNIAEVLEKYAQYCPEIKYTNIDSDENPTFGQKYAEDGERITPGTVILDAGERFRVYEYGEFYNANTNAQGEVVVSSMRAEQVLNAGLRYVSRTEDFTAYFVKGHEERELAGLEEKLATENYILGELNLSMEEIPADAKLLVFAAPQVDYTDTDIAKLDAFFARGGKGLFLFDHTCSGLTNLYAYLRTWGIGVTDEVAVELDQAHTVPQAGLLLAAYGESTVTSGFAENGRYIGYAPYSKTLQLLFEENGGVRTEQVLCTTEDAYSTGDLETLENTSGNTGAQVIAAAATRRGNTPAEDAILFVSGNSALLEIEEQTVAGFGLANYDYIGNTLTFLQGSYEDYTISPKYLAGGRLILDGRQGLLIGALFIIVVPLVVLVYGIVVWFRRRHL